MRIAAYADFRYHRDADGLRAEMPFAIFLGALTPFVDRLVLVGRDVKGRDGRTLPHVVEDPVEVSVLPAYANAANPVAVLRRLPATAATLWRIIDDIDGVILFGPHPVATMFLLLAAVRRRRVVLAMRQDYPKYVERRHPGRVGLLAAARSMDMIWRLAARYVPVVVVGDELAQRYRSRFGTHVTTVSLVDGRDVADEPGGLAASRSSGPIRILSVGRLDAEKNPLLLADILAGLVATGGDFNMTICGDGVLRDDLEQRLRGLGVADRATLTGYVPVDGGLMDLYRSSDVLLHVSWTEGVPQVLVEAFAAGLPVVATDVGGVAAAVGDAGLLIPAGDANAAVAAINRLSDDRSLCRRIAAHGLDRARAMTRQAQAQRLMQYVGRCWGNE